MNDYTHTKRLYREAVKRFPFPNLKRAGNTEHLHKTNVEGDYSYRQDFTFTVAELLDSPIKANGYIRMIKIKDTYHITGLFGLKTSIHIWQHEGQLKEGYIWGIYKNERKTWQLTLTLEN